MWLELNNNQEIDWMDIDVFVEKYNFLYTLAEAQWGVIKYDYYLQELLIGVILNKKIYFYDHITQNGLSELNEDAENYLHWIKRTVNNILDNVLK